VASEADAGGRGRRPGGDSRPAAPVEVDRRGNFIMESVAELKKVEWPNQNQVIQGAVVVIVACVIVGVFLWLNDQVWKQVVEQFLLGQ
jgi:preprotein translocase SecE subunit